MGWRACWGFGTLASCFQIIFILLFRYISTDRSMIVFSFFALVILLIVDQAIQRDRMQIEHIFFFYTLFQEIIIAHERYQFSNDRFHELWMIYYTTFLVVCISTCFKWKWSGTFTQVTPKIHLQYFYSNINLSQY